MQATQTDAEGEMYGRLSWTQSTEDRLKAEA